MDPLWEVVGKTKEEKTNNITSVLKAIPIFSDLSPKELREVEKIIYHRHYKEGEFIFRQGHPGLGMYIIADGSVRIVDESGESGKNVIAILAKGDFFGDLALLDESPRTASVVTCEASEILGFFRPDFIDLLHRKPRIGTKILFQLARIIGERLKKTNQLLIEERKKRS
ncbi:MAG: cyclic nucleotide-binding domain-containing protein [Candidatus Marinimicrobia bacterium]|nr:cyclic nucleotide-binding domain-containing protein [Candidatus Neomarinimicrobiota bacterium]